MNPGMDPGLGNPRSSAPNTNVRPAIGGANAESPVDEDGESLPGIKPDPVNGGARGGLDPAAGRTRPLLKARPIEGKIDVYHVHRGDTLWIISRKYKVRLEAVIDANPALPDPDVIYPGDEIAVPLDPRLSAEMDIAGAHIDKGDGRTKIRSSIVTGRYSGLSSQTIESVKEGELFNLVNDARAEAGVAPLTLSKEISNVARIKADEMRLRNYFDHTSPVYGSPFEMLRSFGIMYKTAGENIAKGQKTAKAVFAAWMNSSGHRANILNESYDEIGIGFSTNGTTSYWVQIYASRK
jgi:uncharacterized YkwD family protein